MQIGISLLSSSRSLIGFEVRKGMEPTEHNQKLMFQRTAIFTIGFLFGYLDITFDLGQPFDFKEGLESNMFGDIETIDGEDLKD